MKKPVWRLNTGKGVPSDLGGQAMYFNGEISTIDIEDRLSSWLRTIESQYNSDDIYAYQTNRTKGSKHG